MLRLSGNPGYVCRSCRHALKASTQHPIKSSTRSFSSTPGRSKTLATFTPTVSPELDALLSRWRSEIFLPSILPPHHTKLIYKQSKNEILTTPPGVTVTVQTALPPGAKNATEAGEENIKLKPMNMFDRPDITSSLKQITEAISETEDATTWDNLIPFLEGIQQARMTVGAAFLPRLARKANMQGKGRWNSILTAASLAKRTDVRLDQRELTRELVIGAHHRGAVSGFSSSGPAKTIERIVLMLEADEHCGKHHLAKVNKQKNEAESSVKNSPSKKEVASHTQSTDMRRDPLVVAARLSFVSAAAIRNSKGKDADGDVTKATQQFFAIVDTLDAGLVKYIQEWHTPHGRSAKAWWRDAQVLEELAVIQCALSLANKVDMQSALGKEKNVQVHTRLRKQLDEIMSEIASARSTVKPTTGQRRCEEMLEAVQEALKKL